MARHGHDKEDGWSLYAKTNIAGISPEEQLDVYERKVDWSEVKQMRSDVEIDFGPEEAFQNVLSSRFEKAHPNVQVSEDEAHVLKEGFYNLFRNVDESGVVILVLRNVPFPWPLSWRYVLLVQDYVQVHEDEVSWFYTYFHDVEHSYFNAREGFVRASMKFSGFVCVPIANTKAKTRLTWLLNMDIRGLVPSRFAQNGLLKLMYLPAFRKIEWEQGDSADDDWLRKDYERYAKDSDNSFCKDDTGHSLTSSMPSLDLDDCLIDEFKDKTIEDQRGFFEERMMEMAREGHSDEDGWLYKGMTNAKGIQPEAQVAVYERDVKWSRVKQLRSTIETTYSCKEVFDFLLTSMRWKTLSRHSKNLDSVASKAISGDSHVLFRRQHQDGIVGIFYKEIPFPWPFTSRYVFIVQDYCQRQAESGSMFFFCYNHDVEHPHFSERQGFQRARMKFQGMVGVPCDTRKATKLTWLVNIDFCGLVPTMAMHSGLKTWMFYPRKVELEMEEERGASQVQERLKAVLAQLKSKEAEIEEKDKQLAKMCKELEKKGKELEMKEKELMGLRKSLP